MELGCFSVSLNVKDINASEAFYRALGFNVIHGDKDQGWLIMKNGATNLGLFQGMFESNILTFNPGWDQDGNETAVFEDIRSLHTKLANSGIQSNQSFDGTSKGPASFSITDPDGNQILIDQHR